MYISHSEVFDLNFVDNYIFGVIPFQPQLTKVNSTVDLFSLALLGPRS